MKPKTLDIFIAICFIVVALAYWFVISKVISWEGQRYEPATYQGSEMQMVGGNTLVGIVPPTELKFEVLAAITENGETLEELVGRIVECESNGNPAAKNPNSTAYGLCQFLDGTWKYVEQKWDMELNRQDPEDQLYACERLLVEEGLKHWKPVWECLGL